MSYMEATDNMGLISSYSQRDSKPCYLQMEKTWRFPEVLISDCTRLKQNTQDVQRGYKWGAVRLCDPSSYLERHPDDQR